uniref:Uncharacterized protein n=1 Tax=Anguilla anguilla TaxID=7936 RepID=A0A0E9QHJ7_ANGAN
MFFRNLFHSHTLQGRPKHFRVCNSKLRLFSRNKKKKICNVELL